MHLLLIGAIINAGGPGGQLSPAVALVSSPLGVGPSHTEEVGGANRWFRSGLQLGLLSLHTVPSTQRHRPLIETDDCPR